MIELIQQHDEEPSVFSETLKARGGPAFIIGPSACDFDNAVAQYKSRGYRETFSDAAPMGYRIVYFDTSDELPGMLEVVEINRAAEEGYQQMAREWDRCTHIVHRLQPA